MLFNPLMSFFAPVLASTLPSAPPTTRTPAFSREVLQTAQQTFMNSQIDFQTHAFLVAHKAMCDAMFAPVRFWAPFFQAKK